MPAANIESLSSVKLAAALLGLKNPDVASVSPGSNIAAEAVTIILVAADMESATSATDAEPLTLTAVAAARVSADSVTEAAARTKTCAALEGLSAASVILAAP